MKEKTEKLKQFGKSNFKKIWSTFGQIINDEQSFSDLTKLLPSRPTQNNFTKNMIVYSVNWIFSNLKIYIQFKNVDWSDQYYKKVEIKKLITKMNDWLIDMIFVIKLTWD